jgi:hypothetical protein
LSGLIVSFHSQGYEMTYSSRAGSGRGLTVGLTGKFVFDVVDCLHFVLM